MNVGKSLSTIGLEVLVLTLFKRSSDNKVRASLQVIADILTNEGSKTTKDQVRYAIDELLEQGKITRHQDGAGLYYSVVADTEALLKLHRGNRDIKTTATPIIYRMYDLFHDQYNNGHYVSMEDLSKLLNISQREVRKIKRGINKESYILKNGRTFKRKILGNNKGYTFISDEKERKEARYIIVNKILEAVDELRIFDNAMNNHDQLYYDMRNMELSITKSISDDI